MDGNLNPILEGVRELLNDRLACYYGEVAFRFQSIEEDLSFLRSRVNSMESTSFQGFDSADNISANRADQLSQFIENHSHLHQSNEIREECTIPSVLSSKEVPSV